MRSLILATLALFVGVSAHGEESFEQKISVLHGPQQHKEESVLYRTCAPNELSHPGVEANKKVTSICLHSTKTLDQAIHDFQIFQVVYADGSAIEYGLLPFTVDPKTSHELDKNVLKARIIARTDSQLGTSTIVEGTVYLVWERRGSQGLGSPMIIGRTPADEPFRAAKRNR
ncbi:MAG: hypothetical protein H6624_19215 [Bdellovibrionaceae bacterium]|nr:hypothetical protein [Bdellovibrionales bacterium]MCB9086479.1 hypothetical protein [Pseudobdellovibrionaceae bacterium]